MNFTAKNLNELRKVMNAEYRGFNHCIKVLNGYWKELAAIGKVDGLRKEHLTAAWMIERLNGTNFCKDGVFGRTTKATEEKPAEFKPRTTWTPGAVLDYLRRAEAIEWKAIQQAVKDAQQK